MKITYTKHAIGKFIKLFEQGTRVTKRDIFDALEAPDHIDDQTDFPKIIVSKKISEKLILRVVFKKEADIITVITFYPARKGRYYESKKN